MSKWQRSMKNIHKQYGKHIKCFENASLDIPKETEKLYEKYNLDLSSRIPMMSVRHTRWNKGRDIDTYDKLKEVAEIEG